MPRHDMRQELDRLISGGSARQITALVVATAALFFVVGGLIALCWGGSVGHYGDPDAMGHLWQLYYYFADPGNQMSMEGHAPGARLIGLVMSTLGSVFLGGLLISTITNVIERRVETCRQGRNYYRLADHIVVIGSDSLVRGIVAQACRSDARHVVVMTSGDVATLRDALAAAIPDESARRKIIVNYGARDSRQDLGRVCVADAREVYILGDDSLFDKDPSSLDTLNVRCLELIAAECMDKCRVGLPCTVSFDSKTTYSLFQYAELSPEVGRYVRFHPFNVHELWARQVLAVGACPSRGIRYRPLDYRPITEADSPDYVHLIVIGFSETGKAMALQAAHIAHYPNWRRRKTRITVVDPDMRSKMDRFKQTCGQLFAVSYSEFTDADRWEQTGRRPVERFPMDHDLYGHLLDDPRDPGFIDIEWNFIQGDDSNPRVRRLLDSYVRDRHAVITVAVCYESNDHSLRSAMYLPTLFYEKEIPILVCQRATESLVQTLNGSSLPAEQRRNMPYRNLRPFGMASDAYDMEISRSLGFCKRINQAYTSFYENNLYPETLDDAAAEAAWEILPTVKRWSNIYAAASIPTKLRSAGCSPEDVENGIVNFPELDDARIVNLAETEHNRWNVEELLLGYRPTLANEAKEIEKDRFKKPEYKRRFVHYDIRPFDGLTKSVSMFDELIIRALPAIVGVSRPSKKTKKK